MMSPAEFWIEAGAVIAAIVLIPLYMGFIHVPPAGALAYAGVGGVVMAVGEDLQFGRPLPVPTWQDVLLWCCAIAGAGGIVYLLSLLLI